MMEKKTYLKNDMHVQTITKNLVSVGQIVDQGMQVRFHNEGCFNEKDGRLIAHGRREGRMFILESNKVRSAMFAMSTDLKLWHNRIGPINLQ